MTTTTERVQFYRRAFDYFAATPPSQLHPSRVICMLYAYMVDENTTEAEAEALKPLVFRAMHVHDIPRSVEVVTERMKHIRSVEGGRV